MKTLVSLLFLATASAYAPTASAACGNVEVSKGDVKIESGKAVVPAAVGSKICSGDAIIAGKDSRAKLKMEDGNELNISPESKIVLEVYQYNAAENKKKVLLNVLSGKVRAATKQENMYNDKSRDGADNSFQVRTKSAVAGVRGTDFLTGYNPKTNASEVVTFRGKVDFGQLGANGQITGSVSVSAGQRTEMLPGQAPSAPKVIPPKDLQQMNSDSKADTTGVAKSGGAAGALAGGDSKSDAKSDAKSDVKPETRSEARSEARSDAKNEPKQIGSKTDGATTATPSERAPASSVTSGGSMLNSSDLGGGAGLAPNASPTSSPGGPSLPILRTIVVTPTVPVCQQCIDAVQASPTKLRINVTVKQ